MTIGEFHSQCIFDSIPLGDGYLIVATHKPSGQSLSALAMTAGDTHVVAPALWRQVHAHRQSTHKINVIPG